MHKVFIFSKHLQWLDYADMARTAKAIGFDGLDLTVRPGGHVLPENVERDLPKVVATIRRAGLIIDTITTAITDADDPATARILETASGLGITQYRLGWYTYESKAGLQQNLEAIARRFQALAALNKTYKIRGDYQNHAGRGFGASLWDIDQVYKNIDTEWLGIRYDIRHATVEGGLSWPTTLQLVQPYIRSLDIKDFKWGYDAGKDEYFVENVPLGEGMVDFDAYFRLLDQFAVRGHFTLHLEYDLGGADVGSSTLHFSKDQFVRAVGKDLAFLRKYAG